ncbi:MAG: hypothetical protein C4336_02455 [Armatimonadota bacterium]
MDGHIVLGTFSRWCFVLIGLLLCLARSNGQGLDPALRGALQQRELAMSQLETKWRWIRKCPPDIPLDLRHQETTWVLLGLGDRFAFWGDLPLIGNPAKSHPERMLLFDNGCVELVIAERSSGGIVWPLSSRWVLGEPLLYVILAGRDPTKWVMDVRVTTASSSAQVVVSGKPSSPDAPYPVYQAEPLVRFFLDIDKGSAVSRIQFARVDASKPGEIRVDRWRRYRDTWLPVHIVLTGGAGGCEQELTLLEVRDSPPTPPEWAAFRGVVTDVRPEVSGLRGVSYKLQGRLPTLAEVKRMQERADTKTAPPSKGWQVWRLIPPLLLILIGALWYWRLRRRERA